MATHKKGKVKKARRAAEQKKKEDEPPVSLAAAAAPDEDEESSSSSDEDVGEKLTLEALEAMSSEEDSDYDDDDGDDDDGEEVVGGDDDDEFKAEAEALRRAITEGAFDNVELSGKGAGATKKKKEETKKGRKKVKEEDENESDDDEKEEEGTGAGPEVALEDDSSASSSDDDEEENGGDGKGRKSGAAPGAAPSQSSRALRIVADELEQRQSRLPWAERYDVVPATPLPFGKKDGEDDDEEEAEDGEGGGPVDVHDDLKREVAFYNAALEATHDARTRCRDAEVPFDRPDDFFAEMVKTDDHMAKVKDRLIFETKKMDAFERRKSNKEIKHRAKEARSHRAEVKARSKKDHLKNVDDWAKDAASGRDGGGKVNDDIDNRYLDRFEGGDGKKRERADQKFGRGGKKGRFKNTDNKGLSDMSGYHSKGGGGAGANRKGKRARDAARSKR